ncbi:DUF349 domain-containing protein [Paucibacter sp. B2R-40]|uniref:DUF349 domain-containing protein n=1 Tax=Paucibacter sp. B2R-40 TaxID=2893554 RepID=UPI0021E502D3|nr:DUF349 domain-containing protein [Paucibacter sp. B2R-40]MCV2356999.1 DUF349 domain-containing protein [Paucibacter sp. B2R-40]
MLSWIFKKFGRAAAPAKATTASRKATEQASTQAAQVAAQEASQKAAQKAKQKAAKKAQELAAAQADWAPRLQAALGDDAALLALALAAPVHDIKLAALAALQGEVTLKQAEREFRNQDKRLHRAAKTRFEAAVAQRETRARAQALIASAQALHAETDLPVNLLSSLDRDWQALDPDRLEPAQIAQFRGLSEALNHNLRQRSELAQQVLRWTGEARQALIEWQAAAEQAAATGLGTELSAGQHTQALQALQARCPDANAAACQELLPKLASALLSSEQIEARLQCLASLSAAPDNSPSEPAPEASQASSPVEPPAASPTQQWQALAPMADAALARVLTQRFEQWRQTQQRAQRLGDTSAPADEATATRTKPTRKPPTHLRDATPEQIQQFEAHLAQAEAAQAAGLLSDMQALLQQIDAGLQGVKPATLSEDLRARHHALLAERSRLRDWEQWGGALALDALVAEAENLAQATLAAAPAAVPAAAGPAQAPAAEDAAAAADSAVAVDAAATAPAIEGAPPAPAIEGAPPAPAIEAAPPARAARLNLKAQREAIQDLRKRWKEVDRLSAGAGHALWPRFDAALQTANEPVAAQLAELKLAREANLASRELLLAELDAVPAPEPDVASLAGESAAHYWKECLRALSAFQLAWRQLGPVEHTVPLSNRDALLQRQRASLERLEAPLQQARRAAEAQREQLIQQAEALLQALQENPQLRDVTQRVRDLQADWQSQARSLPLARSSENELWTRFKAATDAVFAQRSAAFDARDAALAGSVAGYEALLARLTALSLDNADAEIRRTLAEVDRAWRQGGELPRGLAATLDARLQAAHSAALQILAGRSQLIWQAQCEALSTKLKLYQAQETATAPADADEFARQMAGQSASAALPDEWQLALAQRAPAAGDLDEVLLQLEAALDLPASPEMQAARRQLKLKALKDALEGRGATLQGAQQQAAWLREALRANNCTASQSERLQGLIKALAQAPAGSLGAPLKGV